MSRFTDLLVEAAEEVCALTASQLELLESHYQLMMRWNERINLTTVTRLEKVVIRHYAESLFLASFIPEEPGSIADLGSGAGFPGFPIAVVRPASMVALVESNARKCVFLREASRGLSNVSIHQSRAEGLDRRFDLVVSRAVNWKRAIKLLSKLSDRVVLLLGEHDAEEVSANQLFDWYPFRRIPWGTRRILLEGVAGKFHVER